MIALIEILREALIEILCVFTDTLRKVQVPRGPGLRLWDQPVLHYFSHKVAVFV